MPRSFLITHKRYKSPKTATSSQLSKSRDDDTASATLCCEEEENYPDTLNVTTYYPPCFAPLSPERQPSTHTLSPTSSAPSSPCTMPPSPIAGGSDGELSPYPDRRPPDRHPFLGMESAFTAARVLFSPEVLISEQRQQQQQQQHRYNMELVDRKLSELVTDSWHGMSLEDSYECPECGKRYSTSSNLARHRQTHRSVTDKKARKCPHCDKVYVSMPAFSMHVRTHNQGCECPYCGKRFSRPWLLQGHIRTHTGEKPFKCPQCPRAFADKSNLRAHIQTHSTEKPYVCGRCGKAFALKSYLYKHEESSCMRGQKFHRLGFNNTATHQVVTAL